jgi:hypothetical protein
VAVHHGVLDVVAARTEPGHERLDNLGRRWELSRVESASQSRCWSAGCTHAADCLHCNLLGKKQRGYSPGIW